MPIVRINSADDPRLEAYRNLKETNATRWAGRFVAEGEKLVRRLLASDFPVESLLIGRRFEEQFASLAPAEAPLFIVPDELVDGLVGFNFHRGILACGLRKPALELDQLAPSDRPVTLVICPNVQDPENLGGILRIAAAFGCDGVVVGSGAADPFSRRVLRVSMGAALRIPVVESRDIEADLRRLSGQLAVELIATVLDPTAEMLSSVVCPPRLGLLLGSEGHGLDPRIVALAARRVTIPMQPGTDSLNVTVAAGICLYHFAAYKPEASARERRS